VGLPVDNECDDFADLVGWDGCADIESAELPDIAA
jgi:hypothetical protein